MPHCRLFGLSLRDYFAGAWKVERDIEDRRIAGTGRFAGIARFVETDGEPKLRYEEIGTLDLDGRVLQAEQNYIWIFEEDGAEIRFANGRAFHRLQPHDGEASALHDCPPDLYRVRYRFETRNHWHQTWIVDGPRKDYTLESAFTRLHRAAYPVQSPRE